MKRKEKRPAKLKISASVQALKEFCTLMRKYDAKIWFSTDEGWGMHDIDTHYYHVQVQGEKSFRAPCRFFKVLHNGIALWDWCGKYISEIDTEMSYFSHVGATTPTGKTAEFLSRVATFMEKENAWMEPARLVIDNTCFSIKDVVITAKTFEASFPVCNHKYSFYRECSSGMSPDAGLVWEEWRCERCGDTIRRNERVLEQEEWWNR